MDKIDLLRRADKLPEPYRVVYMFYYKDGLTQKQIADKMQLSLYKVRGHLSRARYLLRKESGDSDYLKARKILYNY